MSDIHERILALNSKQEEPASEKTSLWLIILFILSLLVSMHAVISKVGIDTFVHNFRTVVSGQQTIILPVEDSESPAKDEELENWRKETDEKIHNLTSQTHLWALRTWMLSVACNENTNLNASQFRTNPGYLYLDHDWKINKQPETLPLDDYSRELLEKNMK